MPIPLQIQFTLLSPSAQAPTYATAGDAGMDLRASEACVITPGESLAVSTGVAMAIPRGYVGLVHPRSGLAAKHGVTVLNAPGTIDSGYRGELKAILVNHSHVNFVIEVGDRIAQLVIQHFETVQLIAVETLPSSERGTGGFGSTGVS